MKLYYANASAQDAKVIVLGLPYDRTVSFMPGTRYGPEYIRMCTENIEEYSPYQNKSLEDLAIHDAGDMHFETQDWIIESRKKLDAFRKDQMVIALGGEHTVTLPSITYCKEQYGKFAVVHFDAHCDLRDEYLGEKICHATVMRRVAEVIGMDNLYQFGIRSGTKEEFSCNKNIYRFNAYEHLPDVLSVIDTPIYVSIDIDVLDPGIVPAVGTPEPGGISYKELIDSLLLLENKQIIGADIVEYNPLAGSPWASGCTAAEVLRELILLCGAQHTKH
jgi:agmatinase